MDRYSGIAVLLVLAMLVCPVHSIAQGRNDMLVVKYSYLSTFSLPSVELSNAGGSDSVPGELCTLYLQGTRSTFQTDTYKPDPDVQVSTQTAKGDEEEPAKVSMQSNLYVEDDFSTGQQLSAVALSNGDDTQNYVTSEPLRQIKWVLADGQRTIGGLEVQQATCSFRGRDWDVWYAPSIPSQAGPWKFNGLPGLIVEAVDSDNAHAFRLLSVGHGDPKDFPRDRWAKEAERVTIAEFGVLKKKMVDALVASVLSKMPRGTNATSVQIADPAIERSFGK